MDMIARIREILRREYGINTDEELMQASEIQRRPDIGIFVSACGMEDLHTKAVS